MKFPILTSLIVFISWLAAKIATSKRDRTETMRDFWAKERASNAVVRKSLDDLDYITFPFEILPSEDSFTLMDQNIPSSLLMLQNLRGKKVVNLSGMSNSDLKLTYGTANLTVLTEYDENFLTLCREGHLLTQYLYENERLSEAQNISEALIACGSDVSGQFTLLATIYERTGQEDKREGLVAIAEQMSSSRKNAIVRALNELDLSSPEQSS